MAVKTEIQCDCGSKFNLTDGQLVCSNPKCGHALDAVYDTRPLQLQESDFGLQQMTGAEGNIWQQAIEEAAKPQKGGNGRSPNRRGKFNALKINYAGHRFDSIGEAVRYWELEQLRDQGLIWNLRMQISYVLQEGFLDWAGRKQRSMSYKPDFLYQTTRSQEWLMKDRLIGAIEPLPDVAEQVVMVVEDVKGMRPKAYALRAKLFLARYPKLHFYEVLSKKVWNGRRNSLPPCILDAVHQAERGKT